MTTKKTIANMQVKIGGDAKELESSFAKSQKHLKKFTVGMAAMTATVAAAFTGLTVLTNKAAEYADNIDKSSIKTGLARKTLQELSYVADQAGLGFDKVEDSLKDVAISMGNAAAGTQAQVDAYKKLGIEVADSNGKLKSVADVYPKVISKLSEMTNETERNVLGTKLMGESAMHVVPKLAALGKDGMQQLIKRAHDLNLVMGDESIKTLVAYKDNMSTLKQQMTQTVNQAMEPYAKKFNEMTPIISRGIKALGDWVRVPVADKIREEKGELNLLSKSLIAVWDKEDQRKRMLGEITKKYPAFLSGLDSEKIKLDDIKTRLEQVNKQYVERIRLAIIQEDAAEKEKELNALYREQDAQVKSLTNTFKVLGDQGKLTNTKFEANTFEEMIAELEKAGKIEASWAHQAATVAEDAKKNYKKVTDEIKATQTEYEGLLNKRVHMEALIADNIKKHGDLTTKVKTKTSEVNEIVRDLGLNLDKLTDKEVDIKVNYKKGTEKGGEPPKKLGQVESSNSEDLWAMSDWFAEEADAVQAEIDSMNAAIAQGMADMVGTFAEGFGQMAAGDISFAEFFDNILSQFGGFLKQFGEMLIAYGIAEQAFLTSMDPFTKIAAGVALVAIGAALTSLGSSGPGGGGSAPATSATYGSYSSANTSNPVPSGGMAVPASSANAQMNVNVNVAGKLRGDHIAIVGQSGMKQVNRRG